MYVIDRFGAISLSQFNNEYTLSPVPAVPSIVSTSAGLFDNDGAGRSRQQFPHAIQYDCVVAEDTYNNNRGTLDALRAAVGTRSRLYRYGLDDATIQSCVARLVSMPHSWPYEQRGYFKIALNFQQLGPWQGSDHATWRFDNGYLFNAGLLFDPNTYKATLSSTPSQTVANGGNLPVDDVILSLTTTVNALTAASFSVAGYSLIYTGTIAAGATLLIDCGAKAVTVNGVDSYRNLRLGPSHTAEQWFVLQPGNNTIVAGATGTLTGATWQVVFRDGWA
ncbi:MAG: phage tail family protein [Candidatus Hydrogenedentes bacterium]|nr:phage tail family protein [Candidatus Hydrogenedentota bacterium]